MQEADLIRGAETVADLGETDCRQWNETTGNERMAIRRATTERASDASQSRAMGREDILDRVQKRLDDESGEIALRS